MFWQYFYTIKNIDMELIRNNTEKQFNHLKYKSISLNLILKLLISFLFLLFLLYTTSCKSCHCPAYSMNTTKIQTKHAWFRYFSSKPNYLLQFSEPEKRPQDFKHQHCNRFLSLWEFNIFITTDHPFEKIEIYDSKDFN